MGSVGQIIFGVAWTLFSSVFVCVGLGVTWKGVSQSAWEKVPCVIERFEILADQKKNPVFEVDLKFRYEWAGQTFTGSDLRPGVRGDDDEYEKLSEVREKLLLEAQRDKPEGLRTECRVDPKHPENASLLPPSGAGWFGLIFVAFGGGFMLIGISIIRAAIKSRSQKVLSDLASPANPVSQILPVFFSLFALAGLGVTCALVVPGAIRYFKAKSWVETPATIIWSRVKSHSGGDDGTTYSADLFYRYQFKGREYRSNNYNLSGGSSSGRDSKQEIVDSHPSKSALTCYVNPEKPWQAIVHRDPGNSAFFVLFPLPFLGIGVGGLIWIAKKKRAAKAEPSTPLSPREPVLQDLPERILSATKTRWVNFFAALFVCAFWNGIVSMFVGVAWSAWKKGHPETFLMIFLIPFVLIGAVFLFYVPYRLLMVFLARYELRLTPGALKPGGTATLTWKRLGGFGQPKSIVLRLSGSESATYQNGKNSSTATSQFHDELLADLSPISITANRPVAIKLSENAAPSFKGSSNKLVWKLHMDITLPGFPKITDEYEIEVRPLRRDELNPLT